MRMREIFTSPLKDDFAVIKIDKVPAGLFPIPLDPEMDPRKLPKLTRVITLGFPLGSRTQTDTVNVSVVAGNIRRTFENMFQIDASLRGGNSGGPVIDARGKAIGIVSAVAMDFTQGPVPMITPVWDIDLILPITDAVKLLTDLKVGHAKWNGLVDLAAYLFSAQSFEEPGEAAQGKAVFERKRCNNCHVKGSMMPELSSLKGRISSPLMAQKMWNHGPAMLERMRSARMPWQNFSGRESVDLLEYINRGMP